MQDQNNAGTQRDKREMIALLNSGDKRELRAFMQLYSKQIYGRALDITHDAAAAKDATRRVLAEVAALASRSELKENIDAQLMALTDQTCSEALFLGGLVDEALQASEPQMPKDDAPSAEEPCAQAADAERTITEIPESGAERFQMEASAETAFSMAPENSEFWLSEESAEENAPTEETVLEPQKVHASDTEVPNLFDDDFAEPVRRHRKSAKERTQEADEDEYEGASPLLVIAIILLSFLVVFLVWVLVVKLMTSGILPNYDFGFARWFNAHVFELY